LLKVEGGQSQACIENVWVVYDRSLECPRYTSSQLTTICERKKDEYGETRIEVTGVLGVVILKLVDG
jgi:hypothetical protein